MSEEQFRDLIIDHSQHPRCHGELEQANRQAQGDNPLCGDKITLQLQVTGNRIESAAIQCVGCAISTASASMMAERLAGLTVEQAQALFVDVHTMVTDPDQPEEGANELGELAALGLVRRYPMRVKCATLPWHTLRQALDEASAGTVTTE